MTSEIGYQGVSNTHGDLDASPILQRVTKGLTEEGRSDFIPCHFRQVLCHFRQMGWIDNFLKNSLALIQGQYKQTLWMLRRLYGQLRTMQFLLFLQWVGPKHQKHISPKPLVWIIYWIYFHSIIAIEYTPS